MPALNPFSIKNRELPEEEIVVQISRFDRWKDPEGFVKAFKLARKEVDCTSYS
jgi:trehalose synthase